MDTQKKGFRSIYVIYIVLSIVCYLFFQLLVVNLGSMYNWSSLTVNIICGIGNSIFLYAVFFRSLRRQLIMLGRIRDEKVKWKSSYMWVILAGGSSCLFLNNLVSLTGLNQLITTYEDVAERLYAGNVVLMVLQIVVLASVVEELLFRGIIYRAAGEIMGIVPAALLSSFIFAFLHGNLLQGMYAFVMGLLLVFVYEMYEENIVATILFHMASNVLSVIGTMTLWFDFMYESVVVMCIVTVAAGIVLGFSLNKIYETGKMSKSEIK